MFFQINHKWCTFRNNHVIQGQEEYVSFEVAEAIMKAADKELVDAVCQCALNVLKGNDRLTPLQKQRLAKHKRALRALARKGRSLQTKKALLQKGGILGALLGPVLSVLGTALFR